MKKPDYKELQKIADELEELNKRVEANEAEAERNKQRMIRLLANRVESEPDDYYKNYIEELEEKVRSLQRHCNNAVYVYLYQLRSNIDVWNDIRKLRKQLQEDLSQARKNAQT